jgi:hypothetical protein
MQWRVLFVEADDRRSPKPSETGCSESRKFFENSHREKFCRAVTGAWLGRTQTLESVGEKPSSSENADYHTYFVGCDEWGFSVWAHNSYLEFEQIVTNPELKKNIDTVSARLAYYKDAKAGKAALEQALQAEGLHPATIKKAVAVAEADGLFQTNKVAQLEVGPYGKLAPRSNKDGLTPDHSPSFAAIQAHVEQQLGRPLTPAEAKALHSSTNTIVIKTSSHMTDSRTYGGRNTAQQIAQDSSNLKAGTLLDRQALNQRLLADGHTQSAIDAAYKKLDALNKADGWY